MIRSVTCILVLGMFLALFFAVRPLVAGQYHRGTNLKCAECHTMHYSQQHDYTGNPGEGQTPLGAAGPYEHLLRNELNALCLSCHDGQTFAPDVHGENTNAYVRQAGGLPTGTPPYEDWKGHALGSFETAPGGTWASGRDGGLACVDCHHQHGAAPQNPQDGAGNPVSDAYRNLRNMNVAGVGNVNVSYALGTNDPTKDVFLRGWTEGDIAGNYSVGNVDFNKPSATNSGVGQWCQGCHTNFHGSGSDPHMSSGSAWLRHPTAEATLGGRGLNAFRAKLYRVKVMSPDGVGWGTPGQAWSDAPAGTLTPSCFSCHKAHGNQNPFGLVFLHGDGPLTEEGDIAGNTGEGSGSRTLCGQCH